MNSHEEMMVNYLQERGISLEYAKAAGLRAVDANTARSMGFPYARRSQGGIIFPYFNPLDDKRHSTLLRVRYLGKLPCDDTGKEIRYTQPSCSGVEAFFDTNVDWLKVMQNHRITIAITEGEAKALYMNQHRKALGGIVTIALGGVWNFLEKGTEDLTPWLRMVRAASRARRREIIIAFDSDMAENQSIQAAALRLSYLLEIDVRGGVCA
jgi:hypothetical protein